MRHCEKGSDLTLFLFSDVLEIAKRRRHPGRVGGLGSRSPSTMSLRNAGTLSSAAAPLNGGQSRPHKHVELTSLSSVRRVVDLIDGEECRDCFCLIVRTNEDFKESMYVFQMVSDDISKEEFLKSLCRNIANTMYRQDPETYLVHKTPGELELSSSDLSVNKTYRSLHRVKKAFSFNKTPTMNTSRYTRTCNYPDIKY